MALQVLAQGAAKVAQGAAKVGGQALKTAGSTASKGTSSTASRLSQFRQSTNQARQLNQMGQSLQQNNRPTSGLANSSMQSEAGRRAALQLNRMQTQINPLKFSSNTVSGPETEEDDESEEEQTSRIQSTIQMSRIKGLLAEVAGIEQDGSNAAAQAAASKANQDAAKQAAKKMIPKAANVAANYISTALDLGTGGVSLVVSIFIHLLSLGWLNVEMVYGTWIKKGKDPIIGRLSWDPIPMPVDKNGMILQGLVIMADLIIIIIVVIMFAIQAIMILSLVAPQLIIGYFGVSAITSLLK